MNRTDVSAAWGPDDWADAESDLAPAAADSRTSAPQAGSLIRDTGIEPRRMTDGEVIPSE